MVVLILISTINIGIGDSLPTIQAEPAKSYAKQVLTNVLITAGFTVGTGIFYTLGNNAYEDYKESDDMKSALKNWDKTMFYDKARNICALGALLFLTRALYYQFKNVKRPSSSQGFEPVIDLRYTGQTEFIFGLTKKL